MLSHPFEKMFKTSTYFIKGQLPGVTQIDLLNLYKRELEEQSVNNISTNSDTIKFNNNTFRFVLNRFANKFSSFSKGQIKIVDQGNEFNVYFQAQQTRTFTSAALLAAIGTLFFLFSAGFSLLPFLIGLAIFILLIIIDYVTTNISFPIYFDSLRNSIERELQSRH